MFRPNVHASAFIAVLATCPGPSLAKDWHPTFCSAYSVIVATEAWAQAGNHKDLATVLRNIDDPDNQPDNHYLQPVYKFLTPAVRARIASNLVKWTREVVDPDAFGHLIQGHCEQGVMDFLDNSGPTE